MATPTSASSSGLTEAERVTLAAVCDALIPGITDPAVDDPEFYRRSAGDLGIPAQIESLYVRAYTEEQRAAFRQLLRVFDSRAMSLLLSGSPSRFSSASGGRREAYLRNWRDSRLGLKRAGFQAVKRLATSLFYAVPGPQGSVNPNWRSIGYPGPPTDPAPPPPADLALVALQPTGPIDLTVDCVVVGSGAGGSVAAADLAESGASVLVVEAGPYETAATLRSSEFDMTLRVYAGSGTFTTRDVAFLLLAGRGGGGGTFVNWSTCLRPPPSVLREWQDMYGIPGLTGPEFAADVDRVWRDLEVNSGESPLNANNEVLYQGCTALGYREGTDFHRIERNAVGCQGRCDFCGYGCRYSAKRSTILNYLPRAQAAGARFLFRTSVEQIEHDGSRVRGVLGRYRAEDGREFPVHLRTRCVVAAAGAISTPALLKASHLGSARVGRGLRLHPTVALAGVFPSAHEPWKGPPQTIAVTRFLDLEGSGHGFWIEAAPAHPGLVALSLPWVDGRAHKRWMHEDYRRSTATIVLVRERSEGSVGLDGRGDPVVRYDLGSADRATLANGLGEAARIVAAAGASRLVPLHSSGNGFDAANGTFTTREVEGLVEEIRRHGVTPNRTMLFSAHLMGSCPMGSDPRRAAVRPSGALDGTEGVYVADASVFPSAPGVNPMITIMAMAHRTAREARRFLESSSTRAS
jgi:choline dehydrogenase-like flavoprotein